LYLKIYKNVYGDMPNLKQTGGVLYGGICGIGHKNCKGVRLGG